MSFVILVILLPSMADTDLFNITLGGNKDEFAHSIQQTADGGYIVAGSTCSYGNGSYRIPDWWIIKMDENGNVIWDRTFGGLQKDAAQSIRQTSDGGFIAAGWIEGDINVLKLDANGDSLWSRLFPGPIVSGAYCIRQNGDDGYLVAGQGEENILKLDMNGNEQWKKAYGEKGSGEYCSSIQQTSDGGYVVAGHTLSYGAGEYDIWILKLDENGDGPGPVGIPHSLGDSPSDFSLQQNYPNPFNPTTQIIYNLPEATRVNLKIFNAQGREIKVLVNKYQAAGIKSFRWDGTNDQGMKVPSGVYFYLLKTDTIQEMKKMILIQ